MFVVNGKVWPNLNVESGLYRVRLLNVCNSLGLLIAFVEENSDNYIPFKLFKADISYYEEPLVLDSI
jgi:FtsP/CotA-like multicopper oxidase with cupredoxin domain